MADQGQLPLFEDAPGHNNQTAARAEGGTEDMLILFEIKTRRERRCKVWLELHICLRKGNEESR